MTTSTHALASIETWIPVPHPPRHRHLHLVREGSEPREQWVRALAQSVVEVLAGKRAVATLVNHVSPVVFQALRAPQPDPRLRQGTVLTVRTQPLGEDNLEVAAVVGCPQRTRALTLRLHRRHGRWRCVSVAVL
ncbi:MAG: hypothetical protein IPG68_04525 [Micrococcales bacterium]|nr:hypothetical protein [Micrococcales bacterium]